MERPSWTDKVSNVSQFSRMTVARVTATICSVFVTPFLVVVQYYHQIISFFDFDCGVLCQILGISRFAYFCDTYL